MCMLDGRGMNPTRLTKRIAEMVTQIGFEMRLVGHSRKLVRIGEFGWDGTNAFVRELVRYNDQSGEWEMPLGFSDRAWERIRRSDPEGYVRWRRRAGHEA